MEDLSTSGTAHGIAIEGSFARGVDSLTTCGGGMFVMLIVLCASAILNWYLLKNLLTVIADSNKTLNSLKDVLNDNDKNN